jgi:hypothetical protein
MPRFEDIAPGGGGRFVDAADKEAMEGCALVISAVRFDARAKFGPRYLVTVAVEADGELVDVDFAQNPARDAMFDRLEKALAAGETFDPVFLTKFHPEDEGTPYWTFETAPEGYVAVSVAWPPDPVGPAAGEAVPVIAGERLAKGGKSK